MIKPTAKPQMQLPKIKQVKHPVVNNSHSAHSERKSKHYHTSIVDKMNPTKTPPNSMTVTELPGLAN